MFEVDSRRLIDDIERTVQKASEKSPLDYLDQAKQLRLESEIKMRNIIQAKQEELLELQNESEILQLKETTVIQNYKALNEEYVLSEAELQKQEALQAIEQTEIDQLSQEVKLLESELEKLDAPETSLEVLSSDALLLSLYRGLGVSATIEKDKAETIMLTSSNKEDILTMGLDQYDVEYLSNQIWEFISK